jgi:ribosomal protein L37E
VSEVNKAREERRDGKGFSFRDGNGWYMVRCHECGRENYAMNVPSGQCCWCGFDANKQVASAR